MEEEVSVETGEEDADSLLTLAEGLVEHLVVSDEFVDFLGDTEFKLEEPLVNLDEEEEEEDELLSFFGDLVEVCSLLDDTCEICPSRLIPEEDEEL